jgi:glucose-6-phosphate 1-dehydrogenase
MIERLVVLGGMGDLMGRYLLPAVGELLAAGEAPEGLEVVGVAREERTSDDYRAEMRARLDEHAGRLDEEVRAAVAERISYRRGDATDAEDLRAAVQPERGPAVVYLALPPAMFAPAIAALAAAGFPEGGQLVIEKPFGHDLGSARELNAVVHRCLDEQRVFRIDHFLGMQTVQNVLGLRFANRVLEPLMNADQVERVDIVWDETLTLEGRSFYDEVGALRDMVQNHLLQLLCLVAMEPPSSLAARELRDRKVQLLREVRRLTPDEVAARTVRGRYTAGEIAGRAVPDYVAEEGVDPGRATETFTEVELAVDNWRWSGVPFVLRTGKALGDDRKEVAVWFRPVPHNTFAAAPERPNVLRVGLDPETLSLGINLNVPGEAFEVERIALERDLARAHVSAYGRVLLGALAADPTLSIRDDEVEECWAVVDPIREAWDRGVAPLEEYPAGSGGPPSALL